MLHHQHNKIFIIIVVMKAFRLSDSKFSNLGFKDTIRSLKLKKDKIRPMYRPKGWKESARLLAGKEEEEEYWLGTFWKLCIFVLPTPGSELK